MKEKEKKEKPKEKAGTLQRLFMQAIWVFGAVTLIAAIVGGTLLSRIGFFSGRSGQQVEIYSQEQIDKFITSVLITVQNDSLGQENARADMVFIASFNAFAQKLTIVALDSGMLLEVEGQGEKTLAEAYAPVSYTHLDVYKRQVQELSQHPDRYLKIVFKGDNV